MTDTRFSEPASSFRSRRVVSAGLGQAPAVLAGGQKMDVTFRLRLPAAATPEQLLDWLLFSLGAGGLAGGLEDNNPLSAHDLGCDPLAGPTTVRLW